MLCSVFLTACDLEKKAASTSSTQSSGSSSNGGSNNGGGNGDGGDKDPEIPSKPPVGYTFFTMNDLRFAYPQTWTVDTDDYGDTEISDEAGNNISMSYDEPAMIFQNITAEEYHSILAPMLEAEGITVSNVTAEKRENSLGLEINVIIADLSYQGIPMKRVTYATTLNNNAYAIILTLLEENTELEEKVFDSMVNLNPSEDEGGQTPDPNAPAGYKTFTNYNLRFAYPDAWTTDSSANSRDVVINGGSNFRLYLHSSPKTTMFDDLTDDSFRDTYVEGLQQQYGGTIDSATVEYRENDNGLLVAIIMFSITTENAIEGEIWYCVTIDETTHCLTLRTAVEDETLFVTIFNSLTATDGPNVSNGSESDPGTSTKPEGTDPGPSTKPEDSNPEGTDPGKKGYSYYTDGDLRILLPNNWDSATLQDSQGNNLQINCDESVDIFQNMSAQSFESLMSSSLGSAYTLSSVTSRLMQNKSGIDVNVFAYLITYQGITMQQYFYAFSLNDSNYCLILTLTSPNQEYAELLFDSIENINPKENNKPSDNTSYSKYTTYNLEFSYPSDWTYNGDDTFESPKSSSIAFNAGKKTDLFSTMTAESFERDIAPSLTEESGFTIQKIWVEHKTNQNQLLVSTIYLQLELYGMTVDQTWFSVTVGETTHLIILTVFLEDISELEAMLFDSFAETNGPDYVGNNDWSF